MNVLADGTNTVSALRYSRRSAPSLSRFIDPFGELEPDKPAHRLWPELDVAAADLFVDKCRFSSRCPELLLKG